MMFSSEKEDVSCTACIRAMKRKGLFGADEVVLDDLSEDYLARLGVQDYENEEDWCF
jgi:hypothetical protein